MTGFDNDVPRACEPSVTSLNSQKSNCQLQRCSSVSRSRLRVDPDGADYSVPLRVNPVLYKEAGKQLLIPD